MNLLKSHASGFHYLNYMIVLICFATVASALLLWHPTLKLDIPNGATPEPDAFLSLVSASVTDHTNYLFGIRTVGALVFVGYVIDLYIDPDAPRFERFKGDKRMPLNLVGMKRYTTFTLWCFIMQAAYFVIVSALTILSHAYPSSTTEDTHPIHTWINSETFVTAVWVIFEISLVNSFFVTVVFQGVLKPGAIMMGRKEAAGLLESENKKKDDDAPIIPPGHHQDKARRMQSGRSQFLHGGNMLFMMGEAALNKLQLVDAHMPYAVLFGVVYVIFAWYWFSRHKVYYYFFLDLSKPVCVIGYTLTLVMLPTFFWITRVANTAANEMLVGYVGA